MSIPSDSLSKISSFSTRGTLQPLGRELPSSEEKTTKVTTEILQRVIQQEEESTSIDENHNILSIIKGDSGFITAPNTQKEDLLEQSQFTQNNQEDDLFELEETDLSSKYGINDQFESEALQEEALSVATQSEALQEEALSVATQIEATHENMLSVAEEVQEVAKNTLSIQEENQALTKNNASLEEKFAARNLNHLALQDLNTIQTNNQVIRADVSKLKKAAELVYASIDENNSAATTNVPGQSTPKDIADIDQQFIALNLSRNDVEKTKAVVNAAISDVKSVVEEKKLGLHESLARKKADQIVKEDVVKYGNANFTQARLLNIGDKILEEFRASDLIFKKNPDGTPTPLSNEEFEDLKIAFKKSFIASLTKQGLIKEGEPEKQTKETGGTSIDNTDAKYSTETKKILNLYSFKDLSKESILDFPKIDFLKQSLLVMQSRAYEKAKEEEREQRFVRLTEKIIQVEIHRGIIKTENLKHDISTTNKLAEHLWSERIKKYGLTY